MQVILIVNIPFFCNYSDITNGIYVATKQKYVMGFMSQQIIVL